MVRTEKIVDCGCCGAFHRVSYLGDCRNDAERFTDAKDAAARLGCRVVVVEPDDPAYSGPFND